MILSSACDSRACARMCAFVLPDYKAISHTILGARWVPRYPETVSVQIEPHLELVLKPQVSTLGDALPDAKSVSLPSSEHCRYPVRQVRPELSFATIRHRVTPPLSPDKTIYATESQ